MQIMRQPFDSAAWTIVFNHEAHEEKKGFGLNMQYSIVATRPAFL
jgi:hypothetical protein